MRLRLLAIGLGILLPVAGSFAQTVSFGPATNFAAGSVPTAVAVGDFNDDGMQDLAVPNFTANTVSILVGNGAGSFGAPTSFAVGSNPRSVAVGDFNGDGKSDLATANENSFNVSILLGNGNGTFGSAANFPVGTGAFNPPEQFGHSPSSVAIGDFNNDGKSDLAVANRISNNVSILIGTGTGSFGAATNFTMGTGPSCVAISDLNGDGKSDLAVANQGSNTVSIRLGNGNGSFGAATNFMVGTNPSFVAVGDLNGDSKPDLAVATNDNAILLGNGDGTFSAATDFGSFSYAIADFSGNGKPDAVTNISSNNVTVALDIGTGAFSAATYFSVAIGDFNSDGKLDLAVVNENSNAVSILLNTTVPPLVLTCAANKTVDCGSAWSFDPPTVTTNACSNINVTLTFSDVTSGGPCPAIITRTWRAADACSNSITCTQRVTVADTPLPSVPSCERTLSDGILNTNDWSANVFQNNAGGSSSASPVATGGCGTIGGPYLRITNTVQTGTAAAEAAVFGIYLNNGAIHNPATQGAIRVIDYSECAILFAGAGGVGAGQAAGPALLQGNKFYVVSAMKQITLTNTFLDWNSIAISGLQATDFDLLATGPLGNQIGVRDTSRHPNFCGGGPIQFGFFRANSDSGIGYTTVGGIDSWQVQLDTFLPVTSTLAQTASIGPATDFAAGSYAIFVAVGDFNGDGKPDLAVANYLSNNVSIVLGTGTGSFGAAANFGVGSSPRSVAVEDLNGDGKLDLATANENSTNVSILLGTGNGTFGSAANFSVGTGAFNPPEQFAHSPSSVAIGDLNGDGKPDLAVANRISNNVSILLGTGTGTFGATNNFIVGTGPYSVVIGDLNGDLKPDLAVANTDSNNVSILLGTGTGAFSAATNFGTGSIPGSVAIGEFNGDGKPDLAVANIGSNNVSVLLGNGNGIFSAATNFGVGSNPGSVAIGEFNGDGKPDLAVANRSSNNVSVLLGNGNGTFSAAATFAAGSAPLAVAVGNFNGDGKPDLAVAKGTSNNVSILLNTTVPDAAPPVLTCAANKTVDCGSAWSFDPPTVTSTCSAANVTLTFSDATSGGPCPAVISRTWQATDACGNSVTCTQRVTVTDTPPSVPSCDRTLSDNTFNTNNWSANVFQNNAGGSSSASQVATGGCAGTVGGPYLRTTNAVQAGTAAAPAAVFGIYLNNGAIHDPATQGAIRLIDYSECAILFAGAAGGGTGQAAGPALLQDNKFYVVSAMKQGITLPTTFVDWNDITINGLQAADFDMLASGPVGNQIGVRDPSQHPNFCDGGPIQFGFFRANSAPGIGYTSVGGIDSWAVRLNCYNICGQKFNDLDGDGVKDAGEPNLVGWTISLSGPVHATVQTDTNGYCFNDLPCGTYIVSEVAMPGWKQTAPTSPGTYSVTIGPGMNPRVYDFGNQQDGGCINDLSNEGTDFWLTFPTNYAPDPANPPQLSVDIAGLPGVGGQVTIPGLAFVANWTIPAGGVATVTLPPEADLGALNDAVTNKGIHVTATDEIAVYGLNHVSFSSDAYLGLPSDMLGTEYIVLGYPNVHTDVPELNGTQFAIVATEDNTEVTITPRVTTGVRTAGAPFTVAMNRGDTYQLRNTDNAPSDLSGTIIIADKPIGVFGGHPCANIPDANQFFCDMVVEQLLPTAAWGTSFVAMPLATRLNGDTYRIVASQANTTVTLNSTIVTLNRGDVHEQLVTGSAHITSDKPVLVAQYANSSDFDSVTNSDPFMVLVPPTNLFREEYIVFSMTNGFMTNFVNVVAPNSLTNSIVLDGTPVSSATFSSIPVGGPPSGFSGAQLTVAPGKHTLTQGSGAMQPAAPFGVTVYGFAEYDSYGYPGGVHFGDDDGQSPVITCPNSVTLTVDAASCLATVPAVPVTVHDNCTDNVLPITQTPSAGTTLGLGTVDLVFRATDLAGNQGTCTTHLIVLDPNTPTMECPDNIVVRTSNRDGEVVSFAVTASTPCSPNLNVVCTPASGSRFPLGTTTVTCTAGGSGGVPLAECSFTVTVLEKGSLDVDDNGKADALTDGLLIARRIAGIGGDALIAGVLADNCHRCAAGDITAALDQAIIGHDWDIDNDGITNTNDAILILRYLFGFRGAVLVAGACPGCHAAAIESTLNSMMP